MGRKALETWLFNHSLPLTFRDETSISHSAFLISSTKVLILSICVEVKPASKTQILIFSFSLNFQLELTEKFILKQLFIFPEIILQAGQIQSPALVANYVYDLVKAFNTFYQNVPVLSVKNADQKEFRMRLSEKVAEVIANGCSLLGIEVPNRM